MMKGLFLLNIVHSYSCVKREMMKKKIELIEIEKKKKKKKKIKTSSTICFRPSLCFFSNLIISL